MCAWSRYVLVGGVAGVLVAGLAGSEAAGWLAAVVAVLVTVAAGRLFPGRLGGAACPVPPAPPGEAAAPAGGARAEDEPAA